MSLGSSCNFYSKINEIIKKMCYLGKTKDFWLGRHRYLPICGSVPNVGCGSVRKEELNYCLLICGSVLNCRCGSAKLKRVYDMFLGIIHNSYSKINEIIKKMCSLGKTGDFWVGRQKEGPALAPEDYLGRIKNPNLKKIMSNSCIISLIMRWPMDCTDSRYNFYNVIFCLEVDILAKTQSEGETDVEENILEQQRLLEEEAVTKPDEGSGQVELVKEARSALPEGSGAHSPMDTGSLPEGRSRAASSVRVPPSIRSRAAAQSRTSYSSARSSSGSSGTESVKFLGEGTSNTPSSGFVGSLYGAIKKMRYAALAPRALGASALPAPERYGHLSGSSVEGIFFRHVYEGRANISCSFDPRTLLCHVCEGGVHSILHSDEGLMPKLFVLSDQLFPPKMAARSVGLACGAVIRVEDGSPRELVDTFRKLTEGKNLQVGSVIMICATTHLGRHGTSRYAEDIASAMAALEDDYKGRVRVVHGLPIPGDDVKDMVISRSLLDTLMWIGEVDKRKNYHLPDTVKFYADKVLCNTQAENKSAMATVELPLFLPTTIKGGDKTTF
jgi:hypothetical protein